MDNEKLNLTGNDNEEENKEVSTEEAQTQTEENAGAVQEETADAVAAERQVSTENVDFSADSSIIVVGAQPDNKNKKLPVIIVICVLVILVVLGVIVHFVTADKADNTVNEGESASQEVNFNSSIDHDKYEQFMEELLTEEFTDATGGVISKEEYIENVQQQVAEATTIFSQDVGQESPNQITEVTTAAVGNGSTASNTQQLDKSQEQLKAFLNRSCYIQGALYSQGEAGTPLSMSFDGDNFEIFTNLEGTEISILKIGDVMYIKRPATKQYVELTETVMDMLGLEMSAMDFNFGATGYEEMQKKLYATYDVTVNGKEGVCHEYVNGETAFKFYASDGELRQIDTCDAAGNVSSQIYIEYFSQAIPSDQMTLKGYEKTSVAALFADLM